MRTRTSWRAIVALPLMLVGILGFGGVASAQLQSGNLYGTAKDQNGAALPGVTVTLSGIGATQVQVTDAQGQFRYPRPRSRNLHPRRHARGFLADQPPERDDQRRPQHQRSS